MKPPVKKASPSKAPVKKPAAAKPAAPAATKSPLREWIAQVPAFAKAKPGESDLPEYKKKALPKGTVLSATLTEETADYWRIKDGKIEGKALPRNIRIIEKSEWALQPLPGAADVAPAPPPPPTPEKLSDPLPPEPAPSAAPVAEKPARLTICLRGVRQIAPHLKQRFKLVEEGWFIDKNWKILPVARAVAVHDEAQSPAGRALLERMPGMPPNRFVSDINSAASDVYVLNFSWEASALFYRSRSTGMILPLSYEFIGKVGFDTVDYQTIAERAAPAGLTEADWNFLQEEFEFAGPFNESQFGADVETIFNALRQKRVIVVTLNSKVGQAPWLLKLHERINAVVRPLAEAHGVATIDINDFVQSPDDLAQPKDNGGNFQPRVFNQLAERVMEIIAARRGGQAASPPG